MVKDLSPFDNYLFKHIRKFGTYSNKIGFNKALRSFKKLRYPPYIEGISTTLGEEISARNIDTLCYQCNICGKKCESEITKLTREEPSCIGCGSTVRMRAIVRILSLELFGDSLAIPDFPVRPDIAGIGMSDWEEYAECLKHKLDYKNTYYNKEPKLDITSIPADFEQKVDFIISTDVFEHVEPPISTAFENTYKLLKANGVLIFSVPYLKEGKTIEHFPELYRYEIIKDSKGYILKNITRNGAEQVYDHLVFHGGEGTTLEMRIFSESSLLEEFMKAGFTNVRFYKDQDLKYGICFESDLSLPIAARIK